jgi:hypothetical protein
MSIDDESVKETEPDKYVHGMDWLSGELQDFELSNYRKYQYELVARHMGSNILEVGSGDRSFTSQILRHAKSFDRIISIEPSPTLFEIHKKNISFPKIYPFI